MQKHLLNSGIKFTLFRFQCVHICFLTLCLSRARTLLSPLFEAPSVSPTIPAHDSALPSPQNAPLASGFSLLPRFPSAHTHTPPPQSRFWCWSPGSRGQRGRWTRTREGEPCGCPVLEKHMAGDLRSRLVSRPWDSCCNGTRRLGGRGEPAQRHSHRAQGAAALGGEGERVPEDGGRGPLTWKGRAAPTEELPLHSRVRSPSGDRVPSRAGANGFCSGGHHT